MKGRRRSNTDVRAPLRVGLHWQLLGGGAKAYTSCITFIWKGRHWRSFTWKGAEDWNLNRGAFTIRHHRTNGVRGAHSTASHFFSNREPLMLFHTKGRWRQTQNLKRGALRLHWNKIWVGMPTLLRHIFLSERAPLTLFRMKEHRRPNNEPAGGALKMDLHWQHLGSQWAHLMHQTFN